MLPGFLSCQSSKINRSTLAQKLGGVLQHLVQSKVPQIDPNAFQMFPIILSGDWLCFSIYEGDHDILGVQIVQTRSRRLSRRSTKTLPLLDPREMPRDRRRATHRRRCCIDAPCSVDMVRTGESSAVMRRSSLPPLYTVDVRPKSVGRRWHHVPPVCHG